MIVEQRTGNRLEQWDTDTQIYTAWLNDVITETRPFTDGELTYIIQRQQDLEWLSRKKEIVDGGREAYAYNKAYLAKVLDGTITPTEHTQQIITLTYEMQGVLRLLVSTTASEDLDLEVMPVTGDPPTGI